MDIKECITNIGNDILSKDEKDNMKVLAEKRLDYELYNVSKADDSYKSISLLLATGKLENELQLELKNVQTALYNAYNYMSIIKEYEEYLNQHMNDIESAIDYTTTLRIMLYEPCYSEKLATCFFDKYIDKALKDANDNNIAQLLKNIPSDKYSGDILNYVKSLYKHNDLYKKAKDYMKLRQINALVNKLNRCTDSDSKEIKKILDAVELLYELNGCE